jgi:hypothetical protein
MRPLESASLPGGGTGGDSHGRMDQPIETVYDPMVAEGLTEQPDSDLAIHDRSRHALAGERPDVLGPIQKVSGRAWCRERKPADRFRTWHDGPNVDRGPGIGDGQEGLRRIAALDPHAGLPGSP